jgi:hypothetical protein
MIREYFWSNLLEDVAFDTIQAINSGQLEPYGGVESILMAILLASPSPQRRHQKVCLS